MNRLPRTLAAALELRGWKHQQLAEAVSERGIRMTANTISKIIGEHRRARFDEVAAFAAVLNVPLDWLSQGPDWLDDEPDYGGVDLRGYRIGPAPDDYNAPSPLVA